MTGTLRAGSAEPPTNTLRDRRGTRATEDRGDPHDVATRGAPPTSTRATRATTTTLPRTTTAAAWAEPVRVEQPAAPAPAPKPEPEPEPKVQKAASGCNDNYDPCVPDDPKDGNDDDGIGCE
jgi:hypothetical protein